MRTAYIMYTHHPSNSAVLVSFPGSSHGVITVPDDSLRCRFTAS
ncbi:hypothetical protein ACFOGG_12585 [Brenneria rubrifaciens]